MIIVCFSCAWLHPCLNPILYSFTGRTFRSRLSRYLRRIFGLKRNRLRQPLCHPCRFKGLADLPRNVLLMRQKTDTFNLSLNIIFNIRQVSLEDNAFFREHFSSTVVKSHPTIESPSPSLAIC